MSRWLSIPIVVGAYTLIVYARYLYWKRTGR
jgi:hypothetical protein